MNKTKITDFGKKVKFALIDKGKTLTWLSEEVTKKTGLYLDSSYMNKILTGQRNPEKIITAIEEILKI